MSTIITIVVVVVLISIYIYRWDKWAVKNVVYKRYIDKDRVFVGDEIKITTEISNKKLLPLPWIEVQAEIPNEFNFLDQKVTSINDKSNKTYKVVTSLISYQRVKKHNLLFFDKRGYYSIYDLKLSIGDFFGLKTAEMDIQYPLSIIVYPEIKPLEELIIPYKDPQGEISVKRWIMPDPVEIIGSREYTPNDSFNTIDWKTTAKLGTLHVKKFDFTANPSIMCFLNIQTSKIHWQDMDAALIEKAINIIASITQRAIDEKVPVGYSSNALFVGENHEILVEPSFSKNQRTIILEALARTSYTKRGNIEDLVALSTRFLSPGSVIILLTAYISKELKNQLNYLSRKGYSIKVISLSDKSDLSELNKKIEIINVNEKELLIG